jgi:small nuclear ribonucleoprotein (snRNP)-like protein
MSSKDYCSQKPEVQALIEKVGNKLVRIEIVDGRQYIGIFSAIDKTGTIFAMDCLEVHDLSKGF